MLIASIKKKRNFLLVKKKKQINKPTCITVVEYQFSKDGEEKT